ncbi:MAG: F0F1 ATP synthase subunit gamma [Candidatus Omnitrophica bacterium]|nr:F0F1 ATP synthase subunit gamma [Candidatus Omnitrophota bacterium]
MGTANRVKRELQDTIQMTDVIQTLKDIADAKYYRLMNDRHKFKRFGESFVEFFRLISLTSAEHPLLSNKNPKVGIVTVTIEGSFLGEFNNKIVRMGFEEYEKNAQAVFVSVGERPVERLAQYTPKLKVFSGMNIDNIYQTAVAVKDYLVDEVMNDRLGKIVVCSAKSKSFEEQKTRKTKLLPCDELISKQAEHVDIIEKVIEESEPKEVIGILANLWVVTRLYEIFMDTMIASAAAQASFLEDSVDRMKKEKKRVQLKYLKAKKADIDKSLRETFTSQMMLKEKA